MAVNPATILIVNERERGKPTNGWKLCAACVLGSVTFVGAITFGILYSNSSGSSQPISGDNSSLNEANTTLIEQISSQILGL